jgi:ATP-dependent protease ClpP protease subunit
MKKLAVVVALLAVLAVVLLHGRVHDQLVKIVARIHKGYERTPVVKKAVEVAQKTVDTTITPAVTQAKEVVETVALGHPRYYDATLSDGIDRKVTLVFMAKIEGAALKGKKDIWVRITSPGGEVMAYLLMIQELSDLHKQIPDMHITCVADVMAASAAFYLLEDICDTRLMTTRTVLLAHGIQARTGGNLASMEDSIHLYQAFEKLLAPVTAARMGMSVSDFTSWIYGHDRWMGADEAFKLHAVDAVVSDKDMPAAPADEDLITENGLNKEKAGIE